MDKTGYRSIERAVRKYAVRPSDCRLEGNAVLKMPWSRHVENNAGRLPCTGGGIDAASVSSMP